MKINNDIIKTNTLSDEKTNNSQTISRQTKDSVELTKNCRTPYGFNGYMGPGYDLGNNGPVQGTDTTNSFDTDIKPGHYASGESSEVHPDEFSGIGNDFVPSEADLPYLFYKPE